MSNAKYWYIKVLDVLQVDSQVMRRIKNIFISYII